MNETKKILREVKLNKVTLTYQIIKSKRRSYAIQIDPKDGVLCRVPNFYSQKFLEQMLIEKEEWIIKNMIRLEEYKKQERSIPEESLSKEQRIKFDAWKKRKKKEAALKIQERILYFNVMIPVSIERISIRDQKTRWGSCSSRGNLSFNWKLILAPEQVLDYVVVHEMTHRIHFNHSDAFWKSVATVMPDYKKQRSWLKKNGHLLHDNMLVQFFEKDNTDIL